ncbi:hypothetical protein [Streptomyces xanthii]|uniref:Ferredoxin n=1 Tax=Streptomyces xanthii TaxID=2768069 RepID=A0A7H1BDK4_9ACTN|nr:hypothetical protein [Streptomyces xanthii]QNS06809.1 hypothetical protein IAG42_26630 [Streptomyces xanthii]
MTPVVCDTCGNQVLCEKYSPAHLQIQWTADTAAACPRIAAQAAGSAGTPAARVPDCTALRTAVDSAVDTGRLEVTRREQP